MDRSGLGRMQFVSEITNAGTGCLGNRTGGSNPFHSAIPFSSRRLPQKLRCFCPRNNGLYDFYRVGLDTTSGLPKKLGGFSGGGLWELEFYSVDDEIRWTRALEGVIFYQLDSIGNHAVARCHGPKSIAALVRQHLEAKA